MQKFVEAKSFQCLSCHFLSFCFGVEILDMGNILSAAMEMTLPAVNMSDDTETQLGVNVLRLQDVDNSSAQEVFTNHTILKSILRRMSDRDILACRLLTRDANRVACGILRSSIQTSLVGDQFVEQFLETMKSRRSVSLLTFKEFRLHLNNISKTQIERFIRVVATQARKIILMASVEPEVRHDILTKVTALLSGLQLDWVGIQFLDFMLPKDFPSNFHFRFQELRFENICHVPHYEQSLASWLAKMSPNLNHVILPQVNSRTLSKLASFFKGMNRNPPALSMKVFLLPENAIDLEALTEIGYNRIKRFNVELRLQKNGVTNKVTQALNDLLALQIRSLEYLALVLDTNGVRQEAQLQLPVLTHLTQLFISCQLHHVARMSPISPLFSDQFQSLKKLKVQAGNEIHMWLDSLVVMPSVELLIFFHCRTQPVLDVIDIQEYLTNFPNLQKLIHSKTSCPDLFEDMET